METSSLPFFSNPDYLLNDNFIGLMRRWHTYLDADDLDDDTMAQWEELLLKDFRIEGKKCLKKMWRTTKWRKHLR